MEGTAATAISELTTKTVEYLGTEEGKREFAEHLLIDGLSFEAAISVVALKVPGVTNSGIALDVAGFIMDALNQRKAA